MTTSLTLAVCVYNASSYLSETLRSVLAQTYQDFHLLIVNDCSTDNSLAVIENFFKEHPKQHEIISFDENHGIGYARHFAERHATTRYMMFLDADDILMPHAIEKMYNRITGDADLIAVGCYLDYINEAGKKIGGGIYLGARTKEEFYEKAKACKRIFIPITTIYDRKLALSAGGYNIDGFPVGGPRYQDYCEDLDLWTRMSDLYTEGKAIIVIPEVLAFYRKSNGMSSNTLPMILKMDYVKRNLLLRREGKADMSFVEFLETISEKEMKRLEGDAQAAEFLRNGAMMLRNKKLINGAKLLVKSILLRPSYIWQKISNNLCMH